MRTTTQPLPQRLGKLRVRQPQSKISNISLMIPQTEMERLLLFMFVKLKIEIKLLPDLGTSLTMQGRIKALSLTNANIDQESLLRKEI